MKGKLIAGAILIFIISGTLFPLRKISGCGEGRLCPPEQRCQMVRELEIENNRYSRGRIVGVSENEGEGALACMINNLYRAAHGIALFASGFALALIILGLRTLTTGKDKRMAKRGKRRIIYGILGVIIAVAFMVSPMVINFAIS